MRVLLQDLRAFRLPEKAGLVACFFDALNHLTRRSDLTTVLTRVRGNLLPGGVFAFDVNTLAGVRHPWPSGVHVAEGTRAGRRWCRIARPLTFDRRRGRGGTSFEWFVEAAPGRYRRAVEEYWEIAWPSGVVERELRRAGFEILERWDATVLERALPRGLRTYYLTRLRASAESRRQ
jgi:hypothetical protein